MEVQIISKLISILFVVQPLNRDKEFPWVKGIEKTLVAILWSVSKEDVHNNENICLLVFTILSLIS